MLRRVNRFSFKAGLPRRVYSTPSFVIRYDSNEVGLKCAVVVGKKVDKKAVIRNKIKRQTIEAIVDIIGKEAHFTIVIYGKKQLGLLSKELSKEELEKAFKTINIQ